MILLKMLTNESNVMLVVILVVMHSFFVFIKFPLSCKLEIVVVIFPMFNLSF